MLGFWNEEEVFIAAIMLVNSWSHIDALVGFNFGNDVHLME